MKETTSMSAAHPASLITNQKKWTISIEAAFICFLINLPALYLLTNSLFPQLQIVRNGAPTTFGVALHSLIYLLITRVTMGS